VGISIDSIYIEVAPDDSLARTARGAVAVLLARRSCTQTAVATIAITS
jgi:hypothetical protein